MLVVRREEQALRRPLVHAQVRVHDVDLARAWQTARWKPFANSIGTLSDTTQYSVSALLLRPIQQGYVSFTCRHTHARVLFARPAVTTSSSTSAPRPTRRRGASAAERFAHVTCAPRFLNARNGVASRVNEFELTCEAEVGSEVAAVRARAARVPVSVGMEMCLRCVALLRY